MGKVCCGFGHRMSEPIDTELLSGILENLIKTCGVDSFYIGGMGDFDNAFLNCVKNLKIRNNDISIKLIKPYFSNQLNNYKEFYELFDEIIIPELSSQAYYKNAIRIRNRWMIDKSDFVISGIYKEYGGAYEAIKYAQKTGKKIINLKSQVF